MLDKAVARLPDHDRCGHDLSVARGHGERAAGEHHAPVTGIVVEPSRAGRRVARDGERGRSVRHRVDHGGSVGVQSLHVVVGLLRRAGIGAVDVLVERRHGQRHSRDRGSLEEIDADRRHARAVLLIGVRRVVHESDRQASVASHQVVGVSAQVRIGPLRHEHVVEGIGTLVDDPVLDEHGVPERALLVEGERRLLDLDAQDPLVLGESVVAGRIRMVGLIGVVVDGPAASGRREYRRDSCHRGRPSPPERHAAPLPRCNPPAPRHASRYRCSGATACTPCTRPWWDRRRPCLPSHPDRTRRSTRRRRHASALRPGRPARARGEHRRLGRPLRELESGVSGALVVGERAGVGHHHR